MFKIGFMGMGKMGSALLRGIMGRGLYKKEEIAFFAPSKATQEKYTKEGLFLASDERALFENSNLVILAIKPQKYDEIFKKLEFCPSEGKTIISLAPGKSLAYLASVFKGSRIARAMPNTPAIIGKAVSTLAFLEEPITEVLEIFSSIGTYSIVEEKQIDEAIPLQGSMPAYLFEFARGFIEAGASHGIEREEAKRLVLHSIIGSCYLALESDEPLETLIDNVCSKGGSTIAGLDKLKEAGFAKAIGDCYDACVKRSLELAKV